MSFKSNKINILKIQTEMIAVEHYPDINGSTILLSNGNKLSISCDKLEDNNTIMNLITSNLQDHIKSTYPVVELDFDVTIILLKE